MADRPDQTKDVSLREMVEAMSYYRDDETFRWFQPSVVGDRGWAVPAGPALRVTMGQVRRELGIVGRENPGIIAFVNALKEP